MKSNRLLLVFQVMSVLFLIGCRKEQPIIYEYREAYIGDYNFTITYKYFDGFSTSSQSVSQTTGRIEYFNGYSDNFDDLEHKLGIYTSDNYATPQASCYKGLSYTETRFIHPTVTEKGILTYPEYMCIVWGYTTWFSGKFYGDTMVVIKYGRGDASFDLSYKIVGVKIK